MEKVKTVENQLNIETSNNVTNISTETEDFLSRSLDENDGRISPVVMSASNILSNSKQVHPLNKPYQCDLCPKTFTKPFYLNLHRKVHLKPPKVYECFQCNEIFATSGKLATHEKAVHKDSVDFPCSQCDQSFTLFRAYVSHQKSHSSEKPLTCDLCDKPFAYSSQLAAHMRVHTGERPFQCHLCQKKFTYSGHLTVHMRSHTGDRPYKCDSCTKSFTQSSDLTHHSKIHLGVKPHTCAMCSKSFTHAGQLIVHLRKHSGEKPYRCEHCHKRFAQSSHLTLHIRSHTGEKPYRCGRCDKSFVDSSHLAVHTRTHTGEKPFECPFSDCKRLFARSSQLARHRRCCQYNKNKTAVPEKERPFRCTFCPRAFSAENHLDCHTQVHVSEKPYACQKCRKTFYKSSHLTAHMQTHTGVERPYQCPECSRAFTQSTYLYDHRKNIHRVLDAKPDIPEQTSEKDNNGYNEDDMKEEENDVLSSSSDGIGSLIELTSFTPLVCRPDFSSMEEDSKVSTGSLEQFVNNHLCRNEQKENNLSSVKCYSSGPVFSGSLNPSESSQGCSDNWEGSDKGNSGDNHGDCKNNDVTHQTDSHPQVQNENIISSEKSSNDADNNNNKEDITLHIDSPCSVRARSKGANTTSSNKSSKIHNSKVISDNIKIYFEGENLVDGKIFAGVLPNWQNVSLSPNDRLLELSSNSQ